MRFELIFSVGGNELHRYKRIRSLTATNLALVAAQIAKSKDVDISEVEVRFVLMGEPRLEDSAPE